MTSPTTAVVPRPISDAGTSDAGASAGAGGSAAPVAIARSPEENALVDEIRRAGEACAPPAKWSTCQDALERLKNARRAGTAVPDAFLLDYLEREQSADVRRAAAVLFVDLDRGSPVFRDPALASRLVDATERESDRETSLNLASAIGNIDLDATKLDARIRDLASARKESLVAGNIASRVIRNAKSSPAAARVVDAWLAGPPSEFRHFVKLTVSNEANAR